MMPVEDQEVSCAVNGWFHLACLFLARGVYGTSVTLYLGTCCKYLEKGTAKPEQWEVLHSRANTPQRDCGP